MWIPDSENRAIRVHTAITGFPPESPPFPRVAVIFPRRHKSPTRKMRGAVFFTAALFAFFLSNGTSVFAAGNREETERISADREKWSCLFTELKGEGVSEQYSYLLKSIPLLLMEEAEDIPSRTLSEDEVLSHGKRLVQRALYEKEKKLNGLIQKRDEHFIQNSDKKLLSVQEDLEKLREEISRLRKVLKAPEEERVSKDLDMLDIIDLDIEEKLPLVFNSGDSLSDLGTYPEISLSHYAERNEADGVVYGELEQVEDALYLELKTYNRDTDTALTIYEGAFFPDRVEEFVAGLSKELASVLIGREWAHLEIEIEPEAATVKVGGDTYSGGKRELKFLEPGEFTVSIEAPGYERKETRVELQNAGAHTLKESLKPIDTVDLRFESSPPGVDIFSDTVHLGTAPLTIKEAVLPITILAKSPGFYDETFVIGERPEDGELNINLHPLSIDKKQIVEAARDRFYVGVAGFFLSLPVTLIGYGMSTEYAYAHNEAQTEGSAEEGKRLKELSRVWYTAYLGGLFLNGVFLADSVIHMNKYIRAAEGR